jgi:peptidoglycan/LPS O-acetylase OafA/YrhL
MTSGLATATLPAPAGGGKYRADIDGLRALAILPVVFYHYKIPFIARGGFVGVDVFFIISGFLITRILWREIQEGHYSILRFYQRRAQRILPALLLVIIACCAFGAFFALNIDARAMISNVRASVLFYANIQDSKIGYFDAESELNPLLHIWSLSVEEQFYLLFPPLLWLLTRFTRRVAPVLGLLAVISLAASVYMVRIDRNLDFYLAQYRAWELLIGALIALLFAAPLSRRWLAELLGVLGLAFIMGSVLRFSEGLLFTGWLSAWVPPFPGWIAAIPCLGAAFIIVSGNGHATWTSRFLSLPPLRFIGLISYSLYLWHWPVLVFYRLLAGEPHGIVLKSGLILLCLGLAAFSWWYVERPFRFPAPRRTASRVLLVAGAAMAATVLISFLVVPVNGLIWKSRNRDFPMLAALDYDHFRSFREDACFLTPTSPERQGWIKEECLRFQPGRKNILILGDSHAADLWRGFSHAYPDVNFLQATSTGCRPVIPTEGRPSCRGLFDWIFTTYLPQHHMDAIVLSGKWQPYDIRRLPATATALESYADHVIVLGEPDTYELPLPRLLALDQYWGSHSIVGHGRLLTAAPMDKVLRPRLAGTGAAFVSLHDVVCNGARDAAGAGCTVYAGNRMPLYFDRDHFTAEGAAFVARQLKSLLVAPWAEGQASAAARKF